MRGPGGRWRTIYCCVCCVLIWKDLLQNGYLDRMKRSFPLTLFQIMLHDSCCNCTCARSAVKLIEVASRSEHLQRSPVFFVKADCISFFLPSFPPSPCSDFQCRMFVDPLHETYFCGTHTHIWKNRRLFFVLSVDCIAPSALSLLNWSLISQLVFLQLQASAC